MHVSGNRQSVYHQHTTWRATFANFEVWYSLSRTSRLRHTSHCHKWHQRFERTSEQGSGRKGKVFLTEVLPTLCHNCACLVIIISCYMYSYLEIIIIRAMQRTQDDKAWDACWMGYSIMNNPLVLNNTVELLSRLARGEPGNEARTTSHNYTELRYWSIPLGWMVLCMCQ